MNQDAWNPQLYEKFKAERSQPFFDLMELVHRAQSMKVIDLGCGTGELTARLHQVLAAQKTTGIDSSAEMLKKSSVFTLPGLDFKLGDIDAWNERQAYDLVFSNAALQWLPDHVGLFRKIEQALVPGGQLAIQMPMNHDYPTHVIAEQMSLQPPWSSLLKGAAKNKILKIEEYAKLLFDLGFKEQKVFQRVYGHVLASREGVLEWVQGTTLNSFKSQLSPEQYQKFLAEYEVNLYKQLADIKPFFYPFKRLFLWARK